MKKTYFMSCWVMAATVVAAGHVHAADSAIADFVETNSWHCQQSVADPASLIAALQGDTRLQASPATPRIYQRQNTAADIRVLAHRQGCATVAALNADQSKPALNDVLKALSARGYQKQSQNVSYQHNDGVKAMISETVLKRDGHNAVLVYPMDDKGPQQLSLVTAIYQQQRTANTTPAANDSDKVTVHRKQAGSKGKNGWYPAESTKGDYSVLMPLKFNDFTVKSNTDRVRSVEMLGSRSNEGIRFLASRTFYNDAGQAEVVFKKFTSGEVVPEASRKTLKHKGYDAVLMEAAGENKASSQLVMKVGDTLMLLAVEWPLQHAETAKKLGDIFFNSFKAG